MRYQSLYTLIIVALLLAFVACSDGKPRRVSSVEANEASAPNHIEGEGVMEIGNGKMGGCEAVDLGLSVQWAVCNLGANSPEEIGSYYAWGATKMPSGMNYSQTASATNGYDREWLRNHGFIDGHNNLMPAYDIATQKLGEGWRMPTLDEVMELVDECKSEWTMVNGAFGRKVYGPNGNSIFLPVTGCYAGVNILSQNTYAYYWTSTVNANSLYNSYYMYFDKSHFGWSSNSRYYGRAIRAVRTWASEE